MTATDVDANLHVHTTASDGTVDIESSVASLAHPGRISANNESIEKMLSQLSDTGLDAIEVWYPYTGGESRYAKISPDTAAAMVAEHNLLRTSGSDCHGPNSGNFQLGDCSVSEEDIHSLRQCAGTRRPLTKQ